MAATISKKNPVPLGPGAVALYAIVTLIGLCFWIAFIQNPSHPLIAIPGLAAIPAAGRLHANYFRRIR